MKVVVCLWLVLSNGITMANEPLVPKAKTMDKATLLALLEFVGNWEKSDKEWVDPLTLEAVAGSEESGEREAVRSDNHETK